MREKKGVRERAIEEVGECAYEREREREKEHLFTTNASCSNIVMFTVFVVCNRRRKKDGLFDYTSESGNKYNVLFI